MSSEGMPEGTRVELFARSSLHAVAQRRREAVKQRLNRLTADGNVSSVHIHTWDKKVSVTGNALENMLYERFEEWAAERGVELGPFFETRECYSRQTGEQGTKLVLPVLCLAVYRGGELRSVYPHSTNGGSRSVMDGLDTLESGRTDADEDTEPDGRLVEAAD